MPEAATLDRIEIAMGRALEKQRPSMAANFTHPAWTMSAAEFRSFWSRPRITSVSTVAASGWPHSSPLEVSLTGDEFEIPSFSSSIRVDDLRRNARIVLTTWDDAYHAAIVYGMARLDEPAGSMVRVRVSPTRIYAIRAPAGHIAHRPLN
jgi:hypothetical protein